MSSITHLDLDLLFTSGEGSFRVSVLRSPVGEGQSTEFASPFGVLELENLLLKIGQSRGRTRRIDAVPVAAAKEFGGRLFEAVFANEVRECLRRSLDHARDQQAVLRILLRTADCPELADLPWELLYDVSDDWFIALSAGTPLIRFTPLPHRPRPLHVSLPLKVLVIRSEPVDYGALDLKREWEEVSASLQDLIASGAVEFTVLSPPTLSELRRVLMRDNFHVLHYMGHGGFDQRNGGILLFTDRDGRGVPVTAADLGVLLHDHSTMRMVVLNACEGARVDPADPFAGVADTLVHREIPAVVSMQFEFSDIAAIEFAPALYGALAMGLPVDSALAEARKAVYIISPVEWATPVLHLRADDARLFNLAETTTLRPSIVNGPIKVQEPSAHATDSLRDQHPSSAASRPVSSPPAILRDSTQEHANIPLLAGEKVIRQVNAAFGHSIGGLLILTSQRLIFRALEVAGARKLLEYGGSTLPDNLVILGKLVDKELDLSSAYTDTEIGVDHTDSIASVAVGREKSGLFNPPSLVISTADGRTIEFGIVASITTPNFSKRNAAIRDAMVQTINAQLEERRS